ncbi:hypothetical protein CFR73_09725 [Novacetimonas maltaceti]|uniref:Uncharacterized protein n=1 Tax=Novacetimonas maltaceti TaxID=1203393 RepID=A0A2S3W3X5_9PROT|nr:hypothetical protein [Novacetimonas maltaceti]POF63585.1 hypothetical protein KMAL_07650 [Novacetimonas maltaceti]PYD59856.1 hypothetical protein CFR73_09725 [Novacetimonas maltaceti]
MTLLDFEQYRESRNRRAYVPLMLFLTVIYLAFELAFNARLLDITGTFATRHDVDAIEFYGRVISGLALTLAVWGMILRHANATYQPSRTVISTLFWAAALLLPATYFGEKMLLDRIVAHSTGEQRRDAMFLQYIKRDIVRGTIDAQQITLDAAVRQSPEGKAFLSILPLMAMSVDNIDEKAQEKVKEAMASTVRQDMGGSDGHVFNEQFVGPAEQIRAKFNRYEDLAAAFVRSGRTRHARTVYENALANEITGTRDFIPPGLKFDAFANLPPFVATMRAALKVPDDIPISASMTAEQFAAQVREPMVTQEVERRIAELDYQPETFLDGQEHATIGREAMEAVIAPALALVFSVLGALVHLYKSAYYLLYSVRTPTALAHGIVSCLLVGVIIFLVRSPNEITRSKLFTSLEEQVNSASHWGMGHVLNTSVRWMIQAQPRFYPFNEADRRMLHLTFGTRDLDTSEKAAPAPALRDTATQDTTTQDTTAQDSNAKDAAPPSP